MSNKRHFAQFWFPIRRPRGGGIVEVKTRKPEAVEQKITPFSSVAFYFFDCNYRKTKEGDLWGERKNNSGLYFFKGQIIKNKETQEKLLDEIEIQDPKLTSWKGEMIYFNLEDNPLIDINGYLHIYREKDVLLNNFERPEEASTPSDEGYHRERGKDFFFWTKQ